MKRESGYQIVRDSGFGVDMECKSLEDLHRHNQIRALGSIWAIVPAVVGTIFFVARTSREDRMLWDNLAGYREYQTRVRWRLLPGVW